MRGQKLGEAADDAALKCASLPVEEGSLAEIFESKPDEHEVGGMNVTEPPLDGSALCDGLPERRDGRLKGTCAPKKLLRLSAPQIDPKEILRVSNG